MFASCCPHYACDDALTMTKGEGTKYCYYMIRKNMHESHLFPLPEVVGPVSNPPAKKLEFCFTDMPCQIPPVQSILVYIPTIHKKRRRALRALFSAKSLKLRGLFLIGAADSPSTPAPFLSSPRAVGMGLYHRALIMHNWLVVHEKYHEA